MSRKFLTAAILVVFFASAAGQTAHAQVGGAAVVPAAGTGAVSSAPQARVNMMVRTTISRAASRILPHQIVPNLVAGQRTVNPTGQHVASVGQYPAAPGDDYSFDFPKSPISASGEKAPELE